MDKSIHTEEYEVFLELLREVRKLAGFTQVELAQRLNVTQSYVSKWERGEARVDLVQLRLICSALEITLPTFVRRFEKRLAGRA